MPIEAAQAAASSRSRRLPGLIAALRIYESGGDCLAALAASSPERPYVVSFLNHHAINLAMADDDFAGLLLQSDLLLRDGKGAEMACRLLGLAPGANLNGTDLIPKILAGRRGQRIVLCGTREPWLDRARQRLMAEGHHIVAAIDGFRRPIVYEKFIAKHRPDVLVLGMGMPRQERLAAHLAAQVSHPMLILNGGAIIDFLGGRFSRAPLWMRLRGLEWLYRLLLEPRRLFRRYVIGIPVFLRHVLSARRRLKAVT